MDLARDELRPLDVWLALLVVGAAVLATESWGTGGALAAALAAAAVATIRAEAAPWPVSLAALCTAGAGAVHLAVTGEHAREWWGFGVFFLVGGWLQLAWSAVAPRTRASLLLWAGLAGNLTIVAIWAFSRTTGLPFGPDAGEAEAIGASDAIATALEVVAAAGCAAALVHSAAPVRRARWPLATVVAALTAYALIASGGHG